MKMRLGLPVLALLAPATLVGCDSAPPVPLPETVESAATADKRPTTRQFLSQARHTIRLSNFPLTINAPEDWRVEQGDITTFLQGPTPNGPGLEGEIHIRLSRLPALSADQVAILVREAQDDQKAHPDLVRLVNVRQIGPAQVLERRALPEPRPTGVDESGKPLEGPVQLFQWHLMIFAPEGEQFIPYQLKFADLTVEQYEKDKEALQRLIGSLDYVATPAR